MALNNQGLPSYSFVLFLAFAAFGSYLWSSDPLNTARPPTQNAPVFSPARPNAIPARLWQDPFRVIYIRNGVAKPPRLNELNRTGLPETIRRYLQAEDSGELRVLGVMVSTEAIADAEERRRRRRYALINALAESGYVPRDAAHIEVGVLRGWDAQGNNAGVITPYEWFRRDEKQRAIPGMADRLLVLWLDAAHYHAAPWRHLAQLVKALGSDSKTRKKMRYVILGPAGSGGLQAMVRQAGQTRLCQSDVAGMHILSPFATIAGSLLYQGTNRPADWLSRQFSWQNYNDHKCRLTFQRTIHSDDQLMWRLVLELANRGVRPGQNHVVLLSERDTTFGRALPESFKQYYCGLDCGGSVHSYSYLRGIDGVAPGSDAELGKQRQTSSEEARKRDASTREAEVRRPVGSGQFDYLRRLADEIVLLDKRLRKQDGKGILAIGVLGSDVYDKLLILRALRSRLIGVTFFTTDLDAQFLHPAEFPWTRNLVVGSSFDLKLADSLQGMTPPFRDNYQTALFYSTRMAMRIPAQGPIPEHFLESVALPIRLKPLVFEIGRTGVVPLQPLEKQKDHYADGFFNGLFHEESSQSSLHPVSLNGAQPWLLVVVIAIAGLGLLVLKQSSMRLGYTLKWLGAGMLTLALMLAIAYACSFHEEPFVMLAGVSVWPTEIINSLALVLSLYFICLSRRNLRENQEAIGREYHLTGWAESQDSGNRHEEPDSWKAVLTLMLLVSASMTAVLPRIIRYEFIPVMLVAWTLLLLFWHVITRKVLPVVSLNDWEQKICNQHGLPIQTFWKQYRGHGSLRNRFLRAFIWVLYFQAFATFIFTLFGLEPPPLRGEITRFVDSLVTIGSVLGMLFLLFYMVDATRLCIVWIRGLLHSSHDWRGTAVERLSMELNIPWPGAVHWVKLQMVARRTAEVGRLIYYPFVVIILILFSRINYFDDWGFPQGLAIITSALIAIALYSAIRLRRVAEQVRGDFLDYLKRERIIVSGHKPRPNKPSMAQLDELIQQVQGLREGAFQPFLEQPLVKASLLLLGGVGFSASQFSALM